MEAMYRLILASGSPRRRELLTEMGFSYELRLLEGIEEVVPEGVPPREVPLYLSALKARAYLSEGMQREGELLLTADTVVLLEGEILGKPQDKAEAKEMLRRLSDGWHEVVSAFTLQTLTEEESFSELTRVHFLPLSDRDIDYYVEHHNPLDKAGAYGIQDWIGLRAVDRIEGSYYNVMGLPTALLSEQLKKRGVF